jgi:hypothetical protein
MIWTYDLEVWSWLSGGDVGEDDETLRILIAVASERLKEDDAAAAGWNTGQGDFISSKQRLSAR